MRDNEICYMSAINMVEAIKRKELSPVEIIKTMLDRIDRLNPKINAYCTVVAEEALKEAERAEVMVMRGEELGALHGVPFSIKDLLFTKGVRTTFGSKIYEHFVPEQDDIAVERLKKAGAILLGKTNTPEFGFLGVTDNKLFGVTRNPWNLERHVGGSSGGAAAAVASGLGPLALGTDGGGSVRIPASLCGVFGLKGSFGRIPRGPGLPSWNTLSITGPLTRTVRDTALVMESIAGRDDRDFNSLPGTGLRYLQGLDEDLKGFRIAWSPDYGEAIVDPEVVASTSSAVEVFRDLGAIVEEEDPAINGHGTLFSELWSMLFVTTYHDRLAEWRNEMHPEIVAAIDEYMDTSAIDYARYNQRRMEYYGEMEKFFREYDILLSPATAVPAFDIHEIGVREINGVKLLYHAAGQKMVYPSDCR